MALQKQTGLSVLLSLNTAQFSKGITMASRRMQAFGAKASAIGRSLTTSLTLPMLGIGAMAVKTASQFEFAMAKVQAVSGFTSQEMAKLSQQARKLGATTSKSASEVSELQLELAKLGKSSNEIQGMTESILSLSIAFDQELGESATAVGEIMAQFQIDASETGRVADVMAASFGKSALDMNSLSEAMKNAGAVANTFGFSLEETTALLGVLANNGIKGSDAGTKLKMALSQIAMEGGDVKETFMGLIQGNIEYTEAIERLGKRAAILAPILGKNGEQLQQLKRDLDDSAGSAKAARLVLEDTAKGGFDRLKSAMEGAGIEIGKSLMPLVKKLTEFITGVAEKLSSMTREQRDAYIKTGAFAGALGPLVMIMGKVFTIVGKLVPWIVRLSKVLRAQPWILVATAVGFLAKKMYDGATAMTDYEKGQLRIREGMREADNLYKKEARNVLLLLEKYKLANDDQKKRKEIFEQLRAIHPDIVKDIKDEKGAYDKLTVSVGKYLEKLKQQIRIKQNEAEVEGLISDEIALEDQLADARLREAEAMGKLNSAQEKLEKLRAGGKGDTFALERIVKSAKQTAGAIQQEVTALEKQIETNRQLQQEITQKNVNLGSGGTDFETPEPEDDDSGGGGGGGRSTSEEEEKELSERDKYLAKLDEQMRLRKSILDDVDAYDQERARKRDQIKNASLSGADIVDIALPEDEPDDEPIGLTPKQEAKLLRDIEFAKTARAELNNALTGMVIDMADNLTQGLARVATGTASIAEVGQSALALFADMLINVGKLALQTGIAVKGIQVALKSLNPAVAIAGGLALIALGAGVKSKLSQSVPAFAEGGAVLGPTLALVGEKAGSKGEAIVPFEKMTEFARRAIDQDALGGGNNVVVTGRISGSDIVISNTRGGRSRGRF